MNFLELISELTSLENSRLKIEGKIQQIGQLKNEYIIKLHNHLLANGLYDYLFYDKVSMTNNFYPNRSEKCMIRENQLPYIYMGEGDEQRIDFKIKDNKIKLFYVESWNGVNEYLISFRLEDIETLENITEMVLSKGIKKLESIEAKKEQDKQNRIATLKAQLNQLEQK